MNEKSPPEKKLCFVISPIGASGSATRTHADKLKKYVIERTFIPKGYRVVRADDVGEPGIITNQIVKQIVKCDILVADLSEHNPNVFYELAIRHGLKRPFIHIIDAKDDIPFDNAQVRTIQVDLTDLDSVEAACQQLENQIDNIEKSDGTAESPISVAFDLENLKTSGNPDEAILGVVLEEISILRRDVSSLRNQQRPNPPIRYAVPKSSETFIELLHRGDADVAKYFEKNIEITDYSPPTVYGVLKKGGEWRDVEEDIATIMRRLTALPWQISILPF